MIYSDYIVRVDKDPSGMSGISILSLVNFLAMLYYSTKSMYRVLEV